MLKHIFIGKIRIRDKTRISTYIRSKAITDKRTDNIIIKIAVHCVNKSSVLAWIGVEKITFPQIVSDGQIDICEYRVASLISL